MAQGYAHLDTETICCPICLDLLDDPVSTSCGHNYCFSCITDYWNTEDEKGIHSCPQCREVFTARPELQKNTTLAAVVEQLKKTRIKAVPADHCYAGAEDVACDVCTGRKLRALKSCLVCLVSFCESHLQPHYEVGQYKKHQLVEPSNNLRDNICSQHDEVMKMFCRSDQQCICSLCSVDEHKGHNIVSAAAERRVKQKKLQETQQSIQQRIQEREEELKELQQEVKDVKLSADEAVKDSHQIYSQLILVIKKMSSEVEKQIRSQQEAAVRRLQELEQKLEQELSELRSKAVELQQLSLTGDHCRFLHQYSSASVQAASTSSSSICIHPGRRFEDVTAAVSECSQIIEQLLTETWTNISPTNMEVAPAAEPRTREEFLRYSVDLTLDPNTAHTQMLLSEGNTRATAMEEDQPHPGHPDRFIDQCQVLSRESLAGRCYWEVKVREGGFGVAVAYNNISRTEYEGEFGFNDKSWALICDDQEYLFWFNRVRSEVSGPWSDTVGVYLDHAAGLLSFYSVSHSMTLLHTVRTYFTEPLHAGLFLWSVDASCELVKLGDPWTNISPSEVELWPAAEPTTREEFLRYSADLTLDPNTAHTHMLLSEGNTRATVMKEDQLHPDHPDRFSLWCQVLSRESLTGRCYWEVKVREGQPYVAVAYKNISREGDESLFGDNDKSWALDCDNERNGFRFNGVWSELSVPWCGSTVGVYLDNAAGLLSFYSVSDNMTLLHTVHTTFTQPLHAAITLFSDDASCELVKLGDPWTNISPSEVEVSLAAEPTTRGEFLRYSADLTLDPNTANTVMLLSEGNTSATAMKEDQPCPDHPQRFRDRCQVLSRESLTGRCYWEVKVREGGVLVALAYENISREEPESGVGSNDKSWALECSNQRYGFMFKRVRSEVSGPWSDTVGVYLDHAAGLLSFYSVSDSMTLLHRVHTYFTQPLHAALGLYWFGVSSSCELVKLG